MGKGVACLFALVLSACHVNASYHCDLDTQCVRDGGFGTCQQPARYCSFADPGCGSNGQRYDNSAGELADQCVALAGDAGIDGDGKFTVRINVNGVEVVGSDFPGTWKADPGHTTCTGLTYGGTAAINGTVDDALFQTGIMDATASTCTIPNVPAGTYNVGLLFADVECGTSSAKFKVSIEAMDVGSVDVNTESGGCVRNAGTGHPFERMFQTQISDGTLTVHLSVMEHGVTLSALELMAQ